MISPRKSSQQGAVLLEALIAILIFSIGVLGIIGLQARMIVDAAEAKYRNEAGFFVNRLLGEMWGSDRLSSDTMAEFATNGKSYKLWYDAIKNADIKKGLLGLPGADANPPDVKVKPNIDAVSSLPVSYDISVTVYWRAPGQPLHRHAVETSITAD